MSDGAVQLTPNCPSPAVKLGADGADGTAAATGVPVALADHAPSPTEFPARTCTSYAVPFVRPVIVAVVDVLFTVSGSSVQLPPPVRYRTS